MIDTAAVLDAGLGFFCHAFPDLVLQNPALCREFETELCRNLAEMRETVRYWRKFIPEDGIRLDQLAKRLLD